MVSAWFEAIVQAPWLVHVTLATALRFSCHADDTGIII